MYFVRKNGGNPDVNLKLILDFCSFDYTSLVVINVYLHVGEKENYITGPIAKFKKYLRCLKTH